MRVARVGEAGRERPAVWDGVAWRDATSILGSVDAILPARLDDLHTLPVIAERTRFGPPVGAIGKIVCIGLNYRDHAAETGAAIPAEPVVFLKTPDTVVGPCDDVLIPRRSVKTDYEVELAVVIGRQARYLGSPDDSAACIAGY